MLLGRSIPLPEEKLMTSLHDGGAWGSSERCWEGTAFPTLLAEWGLLFCLLADCPTIPSSFAEVSQVLFTV